MKREDIRKHFPEATDEQINALLDIHTADIGKAKGDAAKLTDDLTAAKKTIQEYETTIADLKEAAAGNEDFKKKFEELEQKIADEKAEAEKKAKEEAEEKAFSERFSAVVGEQKWRDELTEKAVYGEFKKALGEEANKGKGDKEILEALTKDREYWAKDPDKTPSFTRGTGGSFGGSLDDAVIRTVMGLEEKK